MATTGIYWCLVLTKCLSLVASSVLQYSQTVPSSGIVPCPGDRVVLNCTTDAGPGNDAIVFWGINNGGSVLLNNEVRNRSENGFKLQVTMINGTIMSSLAVTDEPVNGTVVHCRGFNTTQVASLRINVT
uniref:Ig-like domain-containing protein n=1 Tax=Amphimedon queenslandica TaxID=400682 RepID=A0A1X7T356_AMPQE